MPKFDENTGFKMPGVGSKEIDSPGNFRDEHHVDKMGYCDNTPDDMLPEGSSPLKARYTSSGYLKDLDVIRVPRPAKKECPEGSVKKDGKCVPVGDTKKPPPQKINPKGSVKVPELGDMSIEKRNNDISVSSTKPSKTKYSGGGTLKNQAEKDFYDKEVKRLGGVQQYRDYYKIGKKITTPGSSSSISSNPK